MLSLVERLLVERLLVQYLLEVPRAFPAAGHSQLRAVSGVVHSAPCSFRESPLGGPEVRSLVEGLLVEVQPMVVVLVLVVLDLAVVLEENYHQKNQHP